MDLLFLYSPTLDCDWSQQIPVFTHQVCYNEDMRAVPDELVRSRVVSLRVEGRLMLDRSLPSSIKRIRVKTLDGLLIHLPKSIKSLNAKVITGANSGRALPEGLEELYLSSSKESLIERLPVSLRIYDSGRSLRGDFSRNIHLESVRAHTWPQWAVPPPHLKSLEVMRFTNSLVICPQLTHLCIKHPIRISLALYPKLKHVTVKANRDHVNYPLRGILRLVAVGISVDVIDDQKTVLKVGFGRYWLDGCFRSQPLPVDLDEAAAIICADLGLPDTIDAFKVESRDKRN